MFAIALRRIDPQRNMARFYAVTVSVTLFGDFAVVKRWGRVNTDGRRSEDWFDNPVAALESAEHQAAVKQRRGYRPVTTDESTLDAWLPGSRYAAM